MQRRDSSCRGRGRTEARCSRGSSYFGSARRPLHKPTGRKPARLPRLDCFGGPWTHDEYSSLQYRHLKLANGPQRTRTSRSFSMARKSKRSRKSWDETHFGPADRCVDALDSGANLELSTDCQIVIKS